MRKFQVSELLEGYRMTDEIVAVSYSPCHQDNEVKVQ